MNREEYNNNLIEMRGPHVLKSRTIGSMMMCVMIALIPQFIVSIYIFGTRCIYIVLSCIVFSILFEVLFNLIVRRKQTLKDGSAIVTGALIAFCLPAGIPIWIGIIGCFIAIVLVKGLFGGIGKNYVNPAATAVVILNFAFKTQMNTWPVPIIGSADIPKDATTIATALEILEGKEGIMPTNWELLLGLCSGAIGQVSAIMLLLGGAFLVWKKIISPIIPISIFGSAMLFTFLIGENPIVAVLSGGMMLGAIFMATDPVTSPIKARAMTSYGIAIGVITIAIRTYVPSITEGIFIAIIVMNLMAPIIEKMLIRKTYMVKG